MITYGEILPFQMNRARQFVANLIPTVGVGRIGRRDDAPHGELRAFMYDLDKELPSEFWRGAWDGRKLIGVVHTGPQVIQALHVARAIKTRHPATVAAGQDWNWFAKYVTGNIVINEIAVDPDYRRRGIGQTLLNAAIDEARTHGVRNMSAAASSAEAASLFEACGWDVQRRGEPLNPARADGLRTLVAPEYANLRWASLKL